MEEEALKELGESPHTLDGMENYLTACKTVLTNGFLQAVSA